MKDKSSDSLTHVMQITEANWQTVITKFRGNREEMWREWGEGFWCNGSGCGESYTYVWVWYIYRFIYLIL